MNPIGRLVGGRVASSAMSKGAEQWLRLSSREKVMVSGLFLFLVVVLFCSFILFPGGKRLTQAIDALHSSRELNSYVVGRLQEGMAVDGSASKKPSASIQELVIQSAKSTGVDIERYEFDRNGYFSVGVSRVDFSKFVKWLVFLENNDIQIINFNLTRLDLGFISCSLSVRYIAHH